MPYSGNPGDSTEDEVRFLLGDTDTTTPFLSDAEVTWLVSTYETPIKAAWQGAMRLMARYAGKADKTVGPTSIRYSGLADHFRVLAQQFEKQGGAQSTKMIPGPPLAGGVDDDLWSDVDWEANLP